MTRSNPASPSRRWLTMTTDCHARRTCEVAQDRFRGGVVQVGHRLVEQQHRPPGQKAPGQSDPRPFSSGHAAAVRADDGVQSLPEPGEPLGQTCPPQGLDELRIGRPGPGQPKVGAQGGGEQVRLVVQDGEHRRACPSSTARASWSPRR